MRTPKVSLRDVTEQDLPILFEFQREAESNAMVPMAPKSEAEFYQHWREKVISHPEVVVQVIEADHQVAGHVCTFLRNDVRQIGYWLGKAFWHRGIATAAVKAFIAQHEPRRPLYGVLSATNQGSFRVLEKCGFAKKENPALEEDGVPRFRMELT